jgi:TetR/AcrR family transcriptional regulator
LIPLKTFQNLPIEKQEKITEAALYEFAEKGYQGASINAIVQTLGIAKGSIYQYFGDKNGLFLYVFSNSMELVKDYLRIVRDTTEKEILGIRLEKTLIAGIQFINDNPVVYRLYIKILSESSMPFREEILLSLKKYSFDYINSFLETAKKNGELQNDIDIIKSGFIIEAVMDKFLLSRAVKNNDYELGIYNADEKTIKNWVSSLITILCNGITL